MSNVKRTSSPLDPGSKCQRAESLDEGTDKRLGHYYLSGGTRPELAFATAYMSQFSNNPSEEHWSGIEHIHRYMKQTINHGLLYRRSGNSVQAFCDADWARDKTGRKPFSGYAITLTGSAISSSSKKQRTAALSTIEAEYMAMCHAAREVLGRSIWQKKWV
ncbi:uncharacterized protein LOC135394403 [Ornithodoros turicata]|uniref:uncharacterized protein LOC135394403 n=1 Tax=Ornithodoros turicata TaxID=34597 RepID=UPI003138FC6C